MDLGRELVFVLLCSYLSSARLAAWGGRPAGRNWKILLLGMGTTLHGYLARVFPPPAGKNCCAERTMNGIRIPVRNRIDVLLDSAFQRSRAGGRGNIRELTGNLPGRYRGDTGRTTVPLTGNIPIRVGNLY